ncbi:hypothetical protein HY450_02255 [Candidatus Pacearchaeota archaeon]|nr:hypothetical protein [Candidatus Pacearchaeota archaeon]
MQIIGFNFTKIHAEKSPNFRNSHRNYAVEFTNFEKEKIDLLKDAEAINLSFRYSLIYEDKEDASSKEKGEKLGETSFEGTIKVSASKEETKDFQKAWKKKQVPTSAALPIQNFILKRCATKSVFLNDEIGLPDPHLKIPQLHPQ